MTTVVDALAARGIHNPPVTVRAAADAGLALPAACVVLMDETAGGAYPGQPMQWGHDPVDPQGLYVKGGPVTEAQARTFVARANAGTIGLQGIGDCQLTSLGYVNRAMELGGVWDPYANQRAGFEGLARLIAAHGIQDGFRAYNGSGPAAVAYGQRSATAYGLWSGWLAGTTAAPAGPPVAHHTPRRDVYDLPATPRPADPNSDPATWPQVNHDMAFDMAGGWEGQEASIFGVQDWPGRSVDQFRGYLKLASWIMGDGRLVPVSPGLSAAGKGGPIVNHYPTAPAWVAPGGAVGLTLNYAAPGGAYLTEGRSA